ncbi:MAG: hypothetical protein CTY16_18850 [Methylobacter sp.]|nr:MAG: hypothetical protein CTY16_18850 [Methylobacter sp.]
MAVTVAMPEPMVMSCAPSTEVAVMVAAPVNVPMSIVIAPAPDVVTRSTPAVANAVSKKPPVVMVCAPAPVELMTTFSMLLTPLQ